MKRPLLADTYRRENPAIYLRQSQIKGFEVMRTFRRCLLVAPKLDRLARSVPDARKIADSLVSRGVKLALGGSVYDPADLMGKMFFNILATFAEFEADLIRMRTREGLAIARSKGKLKGKQPKLSDKQQQELVRMHSTGEYSISSLAELFSVSRPTVYRVLARNELT